MSGLKPNINVNLFKLTDEQKNSGSYSGLRPPVPPQQLEKEFNAFERIDMSNDNHMQALNELFPSFLLKECEDADWELFLAMSRYDRRHKTFVTGCFDNESVFDFKLISYKHRYLNGVKWRTRAGTSPNGTPFARIHTDDGTIYVVEGHRDSLTAILLGFDFIMIPYAGFSLKEPAALQKKVAKREVVFIVEDEAACNCMTKIAKYLQETSASVKFMELGNRDKKLDLSDYVQKFNSIEEVIMAFEIEDKTSWVEPQENQTLVTDDSQKALRNNDDIITENRDITQYMPVELSSHILKLDSIVQTGMDTLATANLSVLASLSGRTIVYDRESDSTGTTIIIYSASFFKSGGGKTAAINTNRHYFLDWKEELLGRIQEENDRRKEEIEIALKSLGSSKQEMDQRSKLESELLELKIQPDVYLEDATAEGLEASIACNSTPLLFIDNFGKYLAGAGKSEHKANLIRMLDNVFDWGITTTRRLKGEGKRAKQLSIGSFGAHFASTVGDSNLKPKDIKANIENGFLNKVLITFQDTIDKPVPLRSSLSNEEKGQIEAFSKSYFVMASNCHFYLGDEAYEIYTEFHNRTSDEFIRRYNNDEDLAGLIIRLLKISKRIACIFEIASQCERYQAIGTTDEDRPKIPISAENMQRAIDFLEYLKREHISKIMLYAQSNNGKLSKSEIILHAIKRLSDDGKKIDRRSIIGRLSKSQRMSAKDLKPIMEQLIDERKIKGNNEDGYSLFD